MERITFYSMANKNVTFYFTSRDCGLLVVGLYHGSQNLFWQRATPVIVGRFAGRTWKNNNKWYINSVKLLRNFKTMYTVYKYGREPHNYQRGGPLIGDPRIMLYFSNFSYLRLPNLPACGIRLWNIHFFFSDSRTINRSFHCWLILVAVRFPLHAQKIFVLFTKSRPRLGPIQLPSQVAQRTLSSGDISAAACGWLLVFI